MFLIFEVRLLMIFNFFFFNDTATTEIYTLSLHDALPIFYSGNHKADIVSNSWGFSAWPLLDSGLGYDVVSTLENILSVPGSISSNYPGTVFTQAMGNGGPGYGTITSPASNSFAISVGASTSWHVASQFSSTGLSYYVCP